MNFALVTFVLIALKLSFGKHFLVEIKDDAGSEAFGEMQRIGSETGDYFYDYDDYAFKHSKIPRKRCRWNRKKQRKTCYKRRNKFKKRRNTVKKKIPKSEEVTVTEHTSTTQTTDNYLSEIKWDGGFFRMLYRNIHQ